MFLSLRYGAVTSKWTDVSQALFHFDRSNPNEELKCFQLNTVTYGTASAPFLAVRCLQQIANDNIKNCPVASKIIGNDFYVDDRSSPK